MKERQVYEVNSAVNMIKITESESKHVSELKVKYKKENQTIAMEQFEKLFGFQISRIVAHGSTKDVSLSFLRSIIPQAHYKLQPRHISGSYRCYAKKENETTNLVLHENVESSWSCLMSVTGRPDYVLLYKK